jgi:hypothetical protein
MIRDSCTICNTKSFVTIYKQYNYPISISSSSQPPEQDRFETLEFIGCTLCGCVQLQTLIDPKILYAFAHNNTYETPTWKEHHNRFSSFILNNTHETHFLEIGGSSGYFADLLYSSCSIESYTILDLAQEPKFQIPIRYIQANCEDFSFDTVSKSTPIILSHVFEHLYNPRKFIENLKKAKIQSIFLSIPNLKLCLEKEFLSFLHVEHTYYITSEHLKTIMAEHSYVCKIEESFKEHSIFFHFEYQDTVDIPAFPNSYEILDSFQKYYAKRDNLYANVIVNHDTFIVPGGHYGQLVYNYLREQKASIVGFLDNDTSKIGKRMYGTDTFVFAMNEVTKYKNKQLNVILNAGPYADEIIQQLRRYNPDITYILV